MQSVNFVGNLTRDPELRLSKEGKPRATFSIAINEGEGDFEKTHFINFTAFGTLAENVVKSLSKGARIIVTGRLDTYSKPVQVDGNDRNLTMVSFIASAVGPDLRWAQAEVTKVRSNSQGGSASVANDDFDDDDIETDETEEVEEKPKPRSRGRATASTRARKAPAKAAAKSSSDDDEF